MSIDAFTVAAAADRSGRPVRLGASRNTVKISSKDTAGALAVFAYEGGEPGGPPLHVHDAQDEMFFVQEGAYLFQVGSAEHRLGAGETIFLPRGVPHAFAQLSASGKLLYAFQPAGEMEAFFEALGALDMSTAGADDVAATFARHGMRVVGRRLRSEAAAPGGPASSPLAGTPAWVR